MQFLDRTGVGTLWSMCKTKFALKDHSHNYLPLSGGTLTGDLLFSNSRTTFRQIRGTCGDNDFWRIGGGATRSNAGYMEIATANDGTEPIYVRQYFGTFDTITRTATLLDDSGNTSFPGTVAAAKFKGALEGNASTASNAATVNGHTVNANVPANAKFTDTNTWRGIQDNLTSSSTSESLSANQGRVLKGLIDNKANSSDLSSYAQKYQTLKFVKFSTIKNGKQYLQTEYADGTRLLSNYMENASPDINGCMSKEDKAKLDGIESGANNYTLPTASKDDFGGVRVSTSYEQYKNSPWPIYVNRDNKIYTDIRGLGNNGQNSVSYIELTEGNATTKYSNKRITLFYGEPYEYTIDLPTGSGTLALTSNIPTKTSQLTNDSTFLTSADKYILPAASITTLGGILSQPVLGNNISLWPVTVSNSSVAYTNINGLNKGSNGDIKSIIINDNYYSTTYSATSIQKQNKSQGTSTSFNFPLKGGTLALMSDVSNSCRFNFVNSVAECKSNRINFLIFNEGYTINIDPLNDSADGTILLIFTKVDVYIKNESKKWYHGENFINIGEQLILSSGKLFLITVIEGAVHAFSIY